MDRGAQRTLAAARALTGVAALALALVSSSARAEDTRDDAPFDGPKLTSDAGFVALAGAAGAVGGMLVAFPGVLVVSVVGGADAQQALEPAGFALPAAVVLGVGMTTGTLAAWGLARVLDGWRASSTAIGAVVGGAGGALALGLLGAGAYFGAGLLADDPAGASALVVVGLVAATATLGGAVAGVSGGGAIGFALGE